MAGIWADFPSGSHGLYGSDTNAMLNGIWASVTDVARLSDDPDPAIGPAGRVFDLERFGNTGQSRLVLPSAQAVVGMAQNVWLSQLPSNRAGARIVNWLDADNTIIAYVYVTTTGGLGFVIGNSSGDNPTFVTDGPAITANAWWHIEAKLVCGLLGAATIEVRVNGVTKLIGDSFSTSAASCSAISIGGESFSTVIGSSGKRKNIVIWDGSGGAVNDFQGTVTVYFQPVDADITTGGWGFSSGSSASDLIGHAGPPVDTDYISADDAPPAPAELQLTDLPPDLTSVRFIVPIVRAAKIDGGDGNIQLGLTPNGSDYDTGPDTPITTAFTYWGNSANPFVSHLNPETGASWLPGDFNTVVRLKIDRTV